MNFSYISLDPVPVSKPGPHAAKELRTHQGIPGIECSASGRLFAVWYAGGNGECRENYVTMAVSDDHGATWKDSVAVVDPPHPDVRAFDSVLWRSPDGELGLDCNGRCTDRHSARIHDFVRANGECIFLSRTITKDLHAGRLVSPDSVLNLEVSHSRPVSN